MKQAPWVIDEKSAETTKKRLLELFDGKKFLRTRHLFTEDLTRAKELIDEHKEPNPLLDASGRLMVSKQEYFKPSLGSRSGSLFTIGISIPIKEGDQVVEAGDESVYILQNGGKGPILAISWP